VFFFFGLNRSKKATRDRFIGVEFEYSYFFLFFFSGSTPLVGFFLALNLKGK
jgi:hypothetical protein